jgi:hypothetical protein
MTHVPSTGIRRFFSAAASFSIALLALGSPPTLAAGQPAAPPSPALAPADRCRLANGNVRHVIYVQFDNTHLRRDDPNVPSDLEQMPHLLNFMRDNGTLLTNDHTALIAHTATGILSSLTGVYGDRMGVPVSNSFRYFLPDGSTSLGVSFAYWTDQVFDPTLVPTATPTDTTFNMLTAGGRNAPAPWVPFTRHGCDVGSIATANTVLENTGTNATGDITKVYGAGSPEFAEAVASNAAPGNTAARALAQTDFVGIAVHCARTTVTCAGAHAQPDVLPDEPGGYNGFKGLFGAKYVNPQIAGAAAVKDTAGHDIVDPFKQPGFPGFDGMSAAVSLGYVAQMQESGIPVTYAYVSDAHDAHPAGPAFGPGQAGYVAALKSYDDAFKTFFDRLAADGINRHNTLFVFTVDEGDHFVGGPPSPAGCDGVNTPCTYSQIGEINANLAGLVTTQTGNTTPFTLHSDSAPTVYVTGNPARNADATRDLERTMDQVTAVNPMTGATDKVARQFADPVEMKLLHMVTADPARTPTFTVFADANYFLFAAAPNCSSPCVTQQPGFAWNHGDNTPDIARTWLGFVGPGVRHLGATHAIWTDHTDVRPTMLSLLRLRDDYRHDGRVILEILRHPGSHGPSLGGAPSASVAHRRHPASLAQVNRLGRAYKQLTAPFGRLAKASLRLSTVGITSGSAADDSHYAAVEAQLMRFTNRRDALAHRISRLLDGFEFRGTAISRGEAMRLTHQARALIRQVVAASP